MNALLFAMTAWFGWNETNATVAPRVDVDNPGAHDYFRVQRTEPATPTLLLFLPGTGSDNIGDYTDFLNTAASHGYYVIGLDYRHGQHHPHMTGCWPFAWVQYADQQVFGTDNHFWQGFPQFPAGTNSIDFRLHLALEYLDGNTPANGTAFTWSAHFWDSAHDRPKWENIVVAGHSQGGEMATWIVKNEPVRGGLIFEALYDRLNIGPPDVGSAFSPYSTASPTCNGQKGDVAPAWVQPGAWVDKFFLIDSAYSSAWDGSWPGHHIELTAEDAGKDDEWFIIQTPTSLSTGWYTIDVAPSGGCSGHDEPIRNGCGPAWLPDFWGMLLDRAKTISTNPVPNP